MKWLFRLLVSGWMLAACAAHATGLGIGGKTVEVPNPSGMALLPSETLLFRFMSASQAASNNRLVAYFVPQRDLAALSADLEVSTQYWSTITVSKMEAARITNAEFQSQVVPIVEKRHAEIFGGDKTKQDVNRNLAKGLDQISREETGGATDAKMKVDEMRSLGVLERAENWISIGWTGGARSQVGGTVTQQKVVGVTTIAVVQDRMFMTHFYRVFDSAEDFRIVKAQSKGWIVSIIKANLPRLPR